MPAKVKTETLKREPTDLLPLCGCEGCIPLETEFKDDPVMLSFLKRTLLKRGWTGVATPAEKLYQKFHSTWAAGLAERGAARMAEFREKSQTEGTLSPTDDKSDTGVPEQAGLAL
jgi:hypothetical protein